MKKIETFLAALHNLPYLLPFLSYCETFKMRYGLSLLYYIPGNLTLYRNAPDAGNVRTIQCLHSLHSALSCIVVTRPLGKYVSADDYSILDCVPYSEDAFYAYTDSTAHRNDIVMYVTNIED